jgi:magnesium-transporting ATPase (P-type)
MITGDHLDTAVAIAQKSGIAVDGPNWIITEVYKWFYWSHTKRKTIAVATVSL